MNTNKNATVRNGKPVREEYYTKGRRKRSHRGLAVFGIFFLVSLIMVTSVAGLYYNYLLNKIQYINPNQESYNPNLKPGDLTDATTRPTTRKTSLGEITESTTAEPTPIPAPTIDWASRYDVSDIPVAKNPNVRNILLIGNDAFSSSSYSRADTIIIVSINSKANTIRMASILRDNGVFIAGRNYGVEKINHAYSYGGPRLLMETIEKNFRVHIDNYIAVGFSDFAAIVDSIGGVEIDVSPDEAGEMGLSPGLQNLSGYYTEWYVRLRKFDSDFQRSSRQRDVLELIMKKAQALDVVELPGLMEEILPHVSTGLTKGEMSSLLLSTPAMLRYAVYQNYLPLPGSYTSYDYTFYLDLPANVKHLQSFLYGS